MATWQFVLTDANYQPLGEVLNAAERKVALPLDKLPTASFRVRLDNPLADPMVSTACYLKAYRTPYRGFPSLQFFGPLVSAEESADRDNATIAVNAVGVGWFLQKRLAGQSSTGTVFPTTDRAQIIKSLIDTAHTTMPSTSNDLAGSYGYQFNPYGSSPDLVSALDTGIDTATGHISAASATGYTAGPFKTILECLNDLATSFDGFDWRITPIENYANGAVTGAKIGRFEAWPVIGAQASNAVYEWGIGRRNIESYKRAVSRETQANHVFHIASAGPDAPGFPTVSAIDTASVKDWRLLEDLAQADILDSSLRTSLAQEHVKVRRMPRQVIEFTPHVDPYDSGRLPQFNSDFFVGDTVRARAMYKGVMRFDVAIRVWGVSFSINELGVEQQTLALVQE